MLKLGRVFVVTAGVSFLTMSTAGGEPLRPSDVLRITFTSSPNPFPVLIAPADTLLLSFDFFNIIEPFQSRSATLFDGARLLGTYRTSFQGTDTGPRGNIFSLWGTSTASFGDPTPIDFTTIGNQTIQNGVIDFRIAAGLVDIDLNRISMILGRSDPDGTMASGVFSNPVITGAQVVPEPGTLLLLGGALAAAGIRKRAIRIRS